MKAKQLDQFVDKEKYQFLLDISEALIERNESAAKKLLEKLAVEKSAAEVIEIIDSAVPNHAGYKLLHLAMINYMGEIVEILLKLKANPNCVNTNNTTPLQAMLKSTKYLNKNKSPKGGIESKYVTEKDPELLQKAREESQKILKAEQEKRMTILEILFPKNPQHAPIEISKCSFDGPPPLRSAITNEFFREAKFLIEKGAKITEDDIALAETASKNNPAHLQFFNEIIKMKNQQSEKTSYKEMTQQFTKDVKSHTLEKKNFSIPVPKATAPSNNASKLSASPQTPLVKKTKEFWEQMNKSQQPEPTSRGRSKSVSSPPSVSSPFKSEEWVKAQATIVTAIKIKRTPPEMKH